jgi:hypothetical protein
MNSVSLAINPLFDLLATKVHVGVLCMSNGPLAAQGELTVKLVEPDVEKQGEIAARMSEGKLGVIGVRLG